MSDLCIGEIARKNHGLRKKYADDLAQEYKTFIDALEKDMLTAVYDINDNECIITKTCDLVLTEEQIIGCVGFERVEPIYNALDRFCQIHNVNYTFTSTDFTITITIDMLKHY